MFLTCFQAQEVVVQDENAFANAKKNAKTFVPVQQSGFSVFIDEQKKPALKEAKVKSTTSTALPETVTAIPCPRVPLTEVPGSPEIICLEDSTGKNKWCSDYDYLIE